MFFKIYYLEMSTFKSIKDFSELNNKIGDKEAFKKIIDINFETGKKLTEILENNLDFEFSSLWEIFIKIPDNLSEEDKKKLWKYFNVSWNKIWSRWIWYYWLFWSAYKIENKSKKYDEEDWRTFWEEYDEYINSLSKLKNNSELSLVYLDNYRNFILLWIYILIILIKSSNDKKLKPIENMSFLNINKEKLKNLIKSLTGIYNILIENMISFSIRKELDNIFMLPDLQVLYDNIKQIFSSNNIFKTKKWKISLERYFTQNNNTLNIWFNKLFRNIREEDNLWIILSFFLQKNLKLNSINNSESILKEIDSFKQVEKNEYILANMYWWIEFWFVAKYLWYESGLLNFSIYHLKNKDTYNSIDDIYYPLSKQKLDWQKVIIVDDNIFSWKTLEKLRTILENNHISIKHLATPRIYTPRKDEKFELTEVKKHIALNSYYILPRIKGKNRNINILIAKKVKHLKKKYGKEFRSL